MKLAFILLFLTFQLHAANWPVVIDEICSKQGQYNLNPVYGGASNVNYKLSYEGSDYFIRFAPAEQAALFADLAIEYEVLLLLAPLNVSAKPLYFDPQKRVLVTEYIEPSSQQTNLLDPQDRSSVLALLRKVEAESYTIERYFKPYNNTMHLAELVNKEFAADFAEKFGAVLKEIDEVLRKSSKKSLCHLDLHAKNVLHGREQFWLVDWEYAMMSHPFLVLASMASIERWSDDAMKKLLGDYMGPYTKEDFYRLYLYRIAIDLFWTAWNEVQTHTSTINNPYSEWKRLFEEAAVQRIESPLRKEAISHLKGQQ